MKALIAFVVMAVVVLTLIEVNERIKSRKSKVESLDEVTKGSETKDQDHCETKTDGDCSACELISVCDKKAEG